MPIDENAEILPARQSTDVMVGSYVSVTDPALVPANSVLPGKLWAQLSSTGKIAGLSVRTADNAWVTILDLSLSKINININGDEIEDYAASSYFTGGSAYNFVLPASAFDLSRVTNPPPAGIYTTVLFSGTTLTGVLDPLNPNSTYKLRFHAFGSAVAGGTRLWRISANGVVKIPIWNAQEYGENVASVVEFTVTGVTSLTVLMESIGTTVGILSGFQLLKLSS